jgi:hypothetical protein
MSHDVDHQGPTGRQHMKIDQAIRQLAPLRARIRGGAWSAATHRALESAMDRLERTMPDLSQIGATMLLVVACAACGRIDLGIDEPTSQALQAAQEAAAAEAPASPAF